ncbi:DOG1 domain-containing protein [Heracleum sosnowskyi]|uniref:DOG1 domain-containing protein n=1 Tax=Heracleum sosnowskyi TaxID=360622 RepID=A0AAD8JJT4_9APIA|nr:DOG1 domain-containing protein [Heracleum sosnowskyi]
MEERREMRADNFHEFFDHWLDEQNQYLRQLVTAAEAYENRRRQIQNIHRIHAGNGHRDNGEHILSQIVERVVQHYEKYYEAKSRCENQDVLAMLSPSWRSKLEDAFLWIGGWRPGMAFMLLLLLYSKLGLQVEAGLAELMRSVPTGDLADLSQDQIRRIDELQLMTIDEEKRITEKMAKQQQKMADSSMAELSHVVTEMIRNNENRPEEIGYNSAQVRPVLKEKEEGLECVLHMADDLRLKTLKNVIDILSPIQAVHFLIAAAELHLRVHEWGRQRDAAAAAASASASSSSSQIAAN